MHFSMHYTTHFTAFHNLPMHTTKGRYSWENCRRCRDGFIPILFGWFFPSLHVHACISIGHWPKTVAVSWSSWQIRWLPNIADVQWLTSTGLRLYTYLKHFLFRFSYAIRVHATKINHSTAACHFQVACNQGNHHYYKSETNLFLRCSMILNLVVQLKNNFKMSFWP